MNVKFKVGNIIEEQTDGLVCSGNVHLNMSGGVNGALLQGGGNAMQTALHRYLKDTNKRYVKPGFVMRIGPEPFHFRTIVYTVSIDAFYDSSIELVFKSLSNALGLLREDGCQSISVPALATGYGHLSKVNFGRALRMCLDKNQGAFSEVRIVLGTNWDMSEVESGFKKLA